jgi:hypothetical protein
MIQTLDTNEIDATNGGAFFFVLAIPAVKLSKAAVAAAVTIGAAAGAGGVAISESNKDD